MRERPILFSAPMVRAILAGMKVQTRRVIKPVRGFEHNNVCRPDMAHDAWAVWWHGEEERVGCLQECPYGRPEDQLWVRETFARSTEDAITYRADNKPWFPEDMLWHPSIFMPRWASRSTLELTDVRVQRVQEISEEDAIAEGIQIFGASPVEILTGLMAGMTAVGRRQFLASALALALSVAEVMMGKRSLTNREAYAILWDQINGKRPGCAWSDNPWVWCLSFRRIQ